MQNGKPKNETDEALTGAEDLSKLFDYPAVGELFSGSDNRRLDDFLSKLNGTRENLERIVRHGSREEAEKATRAVRGIEVTIEFLRDLQNLRRNAQK